MHIFLSLLPYVYDLRTFEALASKRSTNCAVSFMTDVLSNQAHTLIPDMFDGLFDRHLLSGNQIGQDEGGRPAGGRKGSNRDI